MSAVSGVEFYVVILWDCHEIVDDFVQQCQSVFSSSLLKRFPLEISHHIRDTAVSAIVVLDETCCISLDLFDTSNILFIVWVPHRARVF